MATSDTNRLCHRENGKLLDQCTRNILSCGDRIKISENAYQAIHIILMVVFLMVGVLFFLSTRYIFPYQVTKTRVIFFSFAGIISMYFSLCCLEQSLGIDLSCCCIYCNIAPSARQEGPVADVENQAATRQSEGNGTQPGSSDDDSENGNNDSRTLATFTMPGVEIEDEDECTRGACAPPPQIPPAMTPREKWAIWEPTPRSNVCRPTAKNSSKPANASESTPILAGYSMGTVY
ncbi:hypothetical protein CEXT_524721 [Caerostris extrusa]|uniref:Uncharacterized protein n=1 Tax=Caerostris extrusa TaxID=172846 RepID=A0AAV4Y9K7_CAEEX|nr:hypothetical protein CEXT_524721 [Caerostris extrusa]